MDTRVIPETEVAETPISVAEDHALCYLKLVNVGPNTLQETGNRPLPVIAGVPGHLVIGTPDELRKALHNIVDRAMDARFGGEENGSTG